MAPQHSRRYCFLLFPQDGSGTISRDEFVTAAVREGSFNIKQAQKAFSAVDLDNSGSAGLLFPRPPDAPSL